MSKPLKVCHCCNGKGVEKDHELVGSLLRTKREELGISLRAMARKIGVNASFLSQLERGLRRWTEAMQKKYALVLEEK